MLIRILTGMALAASLLAAADTRVADAARDGDRNAVRTLIKQKADVNAASGDGTTALHYAAMDGDTEMAAMLLAAGANPKAQSRLGGVTPLFLAAKSGSAPMIEMLLKAGADASAPDGTGTTPLMLAAASGSVEAVEALIRHGADVNTREGSHGQTPMMFAAALDRGPAIRALIAHGADPELATRVTPLGCGSIFNKNGCEFDDDGKPINEDKTVEEKPAGEEKSAAKANANPKQQQGGGRRVGATLMGGQTALLFAAREGQIEAARALLEAGAKVNNPGAGDKMTPLVMAITNGHYDFARFLLEHGADPNKADNDFGLTPLFATIDMQWAPYTWFPQPVTAREQTTYLDLMKLLLDKGADPNARLGKRVWFRVTTRTVETAGATAFLRAAMASDIDAMKLLIAHGADPKLATASDDTPLMVAAGMGWAANYSRNAPDWMPALKYCVELGNDVNAVDNKGYTAMHGAAFRGDNDMINYLASQGARADLVAKDGNTIADMANGPIEHSAPYPETVALLEKLGSKNSHNCRSDLCVVATKEEKK